MAGSGRMRHRDREPGRRGEEEPPPSLHRVFRITELQRQDIAKALRHIDDARRAIQEQQNRDNREIIRELKVSADRIFDLINELEEIA